MPIDDILERFRRGLRERYSGSDRERSDGDGTAALGPLQQLPGTWKSLPGRGWNMIALPFAGGRFNYRLLMNQYNEELTFDLVDAGVPNRGIKPQQGGGTSEFDQFLATLDYSQNITQIAAADAPDSGLAGGPGLAIHHEPGLWLWVVNEETRTSGIDIARLSTIPHGDSVLALGRSSQQSGPPTIPVISGLPIGVNTDLDSPYMAPYKHFHDNPFEGVFDPTIPNQLLERANQGVNIVRTTTLEVDTEIETGGIVNIPFITRQANAASMKSTFWIQEVQNGKDTEWRLQYSQIVLLDFFPRTDGMPGLIRWPHVSINTLVKQ